MTHPSPAACLKFDIAVVGSSPLSLAFAAIQAKNGSSVCVIEQSPNLGGAWAVDDALALHAIETSPHVFLPNREGYNLLDNLLNAGFQPLAIEPQLQWLSGKHLDCRVAVPISNSGRYRSTLTRAALVHANWRKPMSVARRIRRFVATLSPRQRSSDLAEVVMYPPDGLVGLFDRAGRSLAQLGVSILSFSKVMSLSVTAGRAQLELNSGDTIEAEKVYLTRHSDLAEVHGFDPVLTLKTYAKSSIHFVFIVNGALPRGFIQFCGESPLMFVNDVTDYSPDPEFKMSASRLFCARAIAGKDISLTSVVGVLKQIGYLPQAAHLSDGSSEVRHVKKISEESIRLVRNRCAPVVDFLLSDDLGLMDSIAALSPVKTT